MSMRTGRAWRRRLAICLPAFLVTGLLHASVRPAPAAAAPARARPACLTEQPDAMSAMLTARLCGKPVEVTARRTETAQVWALPEGGYRTRIHQGPVRFRDGDTWRPVDLTLRTAADGSVAPIGHPARLRLSGAVGPGEHDLATLDVAADSLTMVWNGRLPAPVLDGNSATYKDVRPGVDLVVAVTRTGFDQSLVAHTRDAALSVASMTLPLRSRSLSFHSDGPGTYAVRDSVGNTVARIPTALMWDAQTGPSGERRRETALSVRARARGDSRIARLGDLAAGSGAIDLTVSADPAWLADPATRYPVTMDPTIDINPNSDTFVRDNSSTDYSGANQLEFGRANAFTARAFMKWPTAQFAGAHIRSAQMHLWNWYAGSCIQAGWWAVGVAPWSNPLTWATQPAVLAWDGYSTQTAGFDSTCPDNWIGIPVTPIFQRAADARAADAYLGLRAWGETDPRASWKQVRSLQAASSSQVPYVDVDYNGEPSISDMQAVPSTGGCVAGGARPYATSLTPRLRATVSEPDSVASSATFEWWHAGGARIGTATITNVPSGSVVSHTIPAGALTEGGTYAWRMQATDGTQTTPWTPWCEFTVDSVRPAVPNVSSTTYPPTSTTNTWGRGGADQAGEFRLSPSGGGADVVAYTYQLDNATSPVTVDATANPTVVSILPGEDGRRTLTVHAKDRAGNLSDAVTYAFNVGRAGLRLPAPGANVVSRMKLAIDGDPALTRAVFRYRRGPGATELDVPLANLRAADGQAVAAYPAALSALQPHGVWNATDTLGHVGGVVQVAARLYTATGPEPVYQTQWTTVTIDPDGDGAAVAGTGPGTVNLLTGDHELSATDADEFGLAVGRSASSRQPAAGWFAHGERLVANQQQVSTDSSGFDAQGTATLTRVTTLGQGSSTDSLEIVPVRINGDTYASVGGDIGGLRLGMRPGRRYRATGWIYVPAATGLTGADLRALRIVGFYKDAGGVYREVASAAAAYTDGWQELSVDLEVPAGATEAFIRLYNGMPGGSGKKVYWDNLSVKELLAPFGPQWSGGPADVANGDSDYASLAFPSTDVVEVVGSTGDSLTFARGPSGFFPQPGAEDLTLVQVNTDRYELTGIDGARTVFSRLSGSNQFVATETATADADSATSYVYTVTDGRALLTRVIAPRSPGVGDCRAAIPAVGCEVIEYAYATSTTATASAFGDVVDRVRSVRAWSWDPVAGAVTAVEVARYAYDALGRLREHWDPRIAPRLVTAYAYDDAGRVVTLTEPGRLPYTFDHGAVGADANPGRLLRVRRPALAQGQTTTTSGETVTTVVYGVPLTRAAGGPHNMAAATVATWGQGDPPTDATAVFGPQSVPGVNAATASAPGANGYGAAAVHYLNASGQPVNLASPGNQIDSRQLDEFGNVVWSLTGVHRDLALGVSPDAAAHAAELNLPAGPAARAHLLATVIRFSGDGMDPLETTGPVERARLSGTLTDPSGLRPTLAAGSDVVGRPHTVRAYDEAKPDGQAYHLETTVRQGFLVTGYPDGDVRVTRHTYGAEKGGASGWQLRQATSTTTPAGTTYTVFDAAGRTIQEWDIGATGTDARTRLSTYYTAGANADDAACGNKPQWAGQPCTARAAGPVTGHDPARMPDTVAAVRVEQYDRWGSEAVVSETVGVKVRRRTATFDAAGRLVTQAVTAPDATPVPSVTIEYDAATGDVAAQRAGSAAITRAYDALGRVVRYGDAHGGVTRTEYDILGRLVRVSDDSGTATYAYDASVAAGTAVTSIVDSAVGTIAAGYTPAGTLVELRYPGGIVRRDALGPSGGAVARTYTRSSDGAVLYAESVAASTTGQWATVSHTGGSETFTYDDAGRLVAARQILTGACTVRQYSYDGRSNRTAKQTFTSGGACATGTPTATETHTYDTADRLTDAGYRYSAFGAVIGAPGGEALTYDANERVASQELGGARIRWSLDPAGRAGSFVTDQLVDGAYSGAVTRVNHYGGDGDSPRWVVEDTTTGVTSRYVAGPDGTLAAVGRVGSPVRLTLTNLHGDVVLTTDTSFTTIRSHAYDEFGAPTGAANPDRYGWLGGHQRSGEALGGTILMGQRLYRPGLGRFLQVDPVRGGNATAYDYCHGDGVNCTDLDGQISCSYWRSNRSWSRWFITDTYKLRCWLTDREVRVYGAWFVRLFVAVYVFLVGVGLCWAFARHPICFGLAGLLANYASSMAFEFVRYRYNSSCYRRRGITVGANIVVKRFIFGFFYAPWGYPIRPYCR